MSHRTERPAMYDGPWLKELRTRLGWPGPLETMPGDDLRAGIKGMTLRAWQLRHEGQREDADRLEAMATVAGAELERRSAAVANGFREAV